MNVLITGATGLLGTALIERNSKGHNIVGVYLGNYAMKDAGLVRYLSMDICDKEKVAKLFRDNRIDVVIHAAGIADVDFCERHYAAAYQSNVVGTRNIVDLCKTSGARTVYISTNAVFDGKNPLYKENDATNPINNYGRIKLECERLVASLLKEYLIVRPIIIYGWNNVNERKNLATVLFEKLSRGEKVKMVDDIYDNPLLSYSCADAIWELIASGKTGLYHVAGKEVVNRYEYALAIAEAFGLDRGLIMPVGSSAFPAIAPRPVNTSYDTSKLEREIGFKPLTLSEGLKIMNDMRRRKDA